MDIMTIVEEAARAAWINHQPHKPWSTARQEDQLLCIADTRAALLRVVELIQGHTARGIRQIVADHDRMRAPFEPGFYAAVMKTNWIDPAPANQNAVIEIKTTDQAEDLRRMGWKILKRLDPQPVFE